MAEAGAWSSVLTILSLEFKEKTTFLNILFHIENDQLLLIQSMKKTLRNRITFRLTLNEISSVQLGKRWGGGLLRPSSPLSTVEPKILNF